MNFIKNNPGYLNWILITTILLILLPEIQAFSYLSEITGGAITTFIQPYDEKEAIKKMGDCNYKWNCTEWFGCVNRKQTRTCVNIGTCPGTYKKPAEEEKCIPKLPAQLFDIKLELGDKIISDSTELTAWVSFESFGTEPTPANLTYIILDESGNHVYSEIAEVVVYTEEFVIKKFTNLNLGVGEYTLDLKIMYASVTEEFKQDFEIKEEKITWIYYLIGLIALLTLIFVLTKMEQKEVKKARKNGNKK